MSRIGIPHILLIATLAIGLRGEAATRPNFLILISDDQRWDQLSSADQPITPELQTPAIDRLASQGVFFRNAFAPTPICAVARASIMTGRYASSHGMNRFNTPIQPEVIAKSYPALLRKHGYRTGLLGKWGMGIEGTEGIFDHFNGWAGQGSYFHETEDGRIHNSEWLAARADEFLASVEGPFCLTVCYKAPHHPYQPDERDSKLFADTVIPKRPTDTAAAWQAMASPMMENSLNRWCYFDERKDEAVREDFEKNFLRCVASLDRSVGKVIDSLKKSGHHENTIVIFLSDHGYLWGEHGLGGKWVLYEESIRIPLIIGGAGIAPPARGSRPLEMALLTDVAPTIVDLAGIPVPPEMDGISLRPILEGKPGPQREDFFMEHVGVVEVHRPIPDSEGVRSTDWKYIRYINTEPEIEQLFHLVEDPAETRNLIDDPAHAATKERLRKRYAEYVKMLQQ